jgi:hypothetical protein
MGEVRKAEITAPPAVDQPTPEELIPAEADQERIKPRLARAFATI